MSSGINWDGVLQIAYLLIIFIAPALLNRLKGKADDVIGSERPAQPLNVPPPSVEEPRDASFETVESPHGEVDLAEELEPVTPALPKPKDRLLPKQSRLQNLDSVCEPKRSKQREWLGRLPEDDLKRAILLKVILDPPVANRH